MTWQGRQCLARASGRPHYTPHTPLGFRPHAYPLGQTKLAYCHCEERPPPPVIARSVATWQSRRRSNGGLPTCVQPQRGCHAALAMTVGVGAPRNDSRPVWFDKVGMRDGLRLLGGWIAPELARFRGVSLWNPITAFDVHLVDDITNIGRVGICRHETGALLFGNRLFTFTQQTLNTPELKFRRSHYKGRRPTALWPHAGRRRLKSIGGKNAFGH